MKSPILFIIVLLAIASCKSDRDSSVTPYWETDEFWNAPMDSYALDSIIEGRKHIIADNGKPYPIDEYEMCLFRYGEPQNRDIPLDRIIGTWHGYGHIYDPRTILMLNADSTYTVDIEEAQDYDANGEMTYQFVRELSGRVQYNQKNNQIDLKNYNATETLSREAYMKSKNPQDEVLIIYKLEKDTMWLVDSQSDIWPYVRQ